MSSQIISLTVLLVICAPVIIGIVLALIIAFFGIFDD